MLLAIDSGNTNVVFALYEGREQRGKWRISTKPGRSADEYAVWLTQLMTLGGFGVADVTSVVISNVVPTAQRSLTHFCSRYFSRPPVSVEECVAAYDFAIRIARPEQVGADRIANAVAAHEAYEGGLVIIDFGTATTLDLVDPDGAYSGGIIAPGIDVSMEALYQAAAKLPRISVEKPRDNTVVGYDTASAMHSGVFWGYISMIEGLVSRIKEERGDSLTVIATGGLAPLFHETSDVINYVEPDLTLNGLVSLHEAYRRQQT